jgi:hypothetical protein
MRRWPMITPFQRLLAEQTTPLELTYFILVVSALCILIAAVTYVTMMSVLWLVRLRPHVTLGRVFLPTRKHVREFLPEYLLALATSAVMTVTIAEKHDIVDAVLDYDVAELAEHDIESLFPLHRVPNAMEIGGEERDAADLRDLLLGEAQNSADVYAASVLKPVLEAGRAGEVRRLVGLIVPQVVATPRAERLVRQILLFASLLLIIGWLILLAQARVKSLQKSPDSPVVYQGTVRRIALIGVSVALLLASPALVGDIELLAESALGALRHEVPEATPVREQVRRGIEGQDELQVALRVLNGMESDGSLQSMLGELGRRLETAIDLQDSLSDRLAALQSSLDGATQSILGLQTDVETQGTELGGLRGDLTGVRFDIDGQRAGLDRLTQTTRAQFTRLDGVARDVTVNAREVDAVRSDMERILAAFEELSQAVRAREGMEMILVTTTGSYQIVRGNRVEAAGSRWGLHRLPVGIPFVAVGGGVSVPFTLQQGEPRVFELLQRVR